MAIAIIERSNNNENNDEIIITIAIVDRSDDNEMAIVER